MITRSLWRAEWLKSRKRPANIAMFSLVMALLTAIFVVNTGRALYDPDMYRQEAVSVVAWPFSLDIPLDLMSELGLLLTIIFVANTIGSEYTRDTWKMILPRNGSRVAFLLTKLLMFLAALLLLLVVMCAWSVMLGALCALILGLDLTTVSELTFGGLAWELAADSVGFLFYGMLTLVATVLLRSTVGGAIVGLIVPQILTVISFFSKNVALVLPVGHLENVKAHWYGNPEQLEMLKTMMGRELSAEISLAVVLGYVAVFIGTSLWVFKQRDIAGG